LERFILHFLEGGVKNFASASWPNKMRFGAILFAIALTLHNVAGGSAFAANPPPAIPEIQNSAARQLVSDSLRAFKNGNGTLGITLLRRAEKAAPEEGWVHLLLGRALLQAYDAVSAERQLRLARENGISDALVLSPLFDAMIRRHQENRLLKEFPVPADNGDKEISAEILSGRAKALLSLGRADEAALSMDHALALVRDADSLLVRSRIALRQNDSSLARKLIDEALQREPQNGHVMLAKLDDLMRSNDDGGVLAFSEKILKQFPGDIQTRAARIDTFLKNNRDAKAKTELEALAARLPKIRIVQYYRAVFLARAGNYDAAWKIAQALPPNFALAKPPYIARLSEIAIKSGHVEAGAAILSRALAYSQDQVDLRLRLASLRLDQNNPHSALLVLGPIQNSSDPVALHLIGLAKLRTDDPKGALDALTRASQMQPHDPQITFHLAQALDESGNRNAARDLLRKLLASGRKFDDLEKARVLEYSLR
jgi:Flp pilus assembly protein TadD